MLARLVLAALSLWVASTASASPLIGIWGSDLELTPREMKKSATLTLEQRELLSTADLLGRLLAIHEAREIEFGLDERSTRLSYRIVATGSDLVGGGTDDGGPAAPVRMRLLPHGGLVHVSVEGLRLHEVFWGIDAPAGPAR